MCALIYVSDTQTVLRREPPEAVPSGAHKLTDEHRRANVSAAGFEGRLDLCCCCLPRMKRKKRRYITTKARRERENSCRAEFCGADCRRAHGAVKWVRIATGRIVP